MKIIYKENNFTVKFDGTAVWLFFGKTRRLLCENKHTSKYCPIYSSWHELKEMTFNGRCFLDCLTGINIFNKTADFIKATPEYKNYIEL